MRLRTDAALTTALLADPLAPPGIAARGLGGARRLYGLHVPRLQGPLRHLASALIAIKGCNQAFWRDDLVRVNGFDEQIEGWGPEDKELCARLRFSGVRRQTLLFGGIAWHLQHPPASRAQHTANLLLLADTLATQRHSRCGLSTHPRWSAACARGSQVTQTATLCYKARQRFFAGDAHRARKARPRAPWPEHLEPGKPVHRLDRRRPVRAGPWWKRATAGQELKREQIDIDIAFTSVLKRAIRTLWIILDETDRMWIPVERSWRLNERHYGALQGLDKAQTVARHGEAQVKIWRRSYDIPPPPLADDDPRHPRFDARYASVDPALLPATESLKDTLARVLPLWESRIAPELRAGRNVLIAAHGNSLRAMVKMLDDVPESEIVELNIPTGVPLLYDLDERLAPRSSRYLGDAEAVKAAAEAVRRQAEKR